MSIRIRHPWTTQPQNARINREVYNRFGICGGFIIQGALPPNQINSGKELVPSTAGVVSLKRVVSKYKIVGEWEDDGGSNRTISFDTGSPLAQSFTLLARVCVINAPTAPGVIARSLTTADGTFIPLWRNGTNFDMRINGVDYTAAGTWTLGQWYDIEIVSDATSAIMYVDGIATVTAGGAAGAGNWDANLSIGDCAGGGVSSGDIQWQYLLFSNRALPASARSDFRINPWQLFQPLQRKIWVPSAGSSLVDHTISPSGGVSFAGSNHLSPTKQFNPSGGIVLSGTETLRRVHAQIPSGVVTFGGSAPFSSSNIVQFNPSGGVEFSGDISFIKTRVQEPSGGVIFGGTSPLSFIPAGGFTSGDVNRISMGVSRSGRLS